MHDTTKKKLNSKAKGNRVELALCKLLSARFGRPFSRSVGSGNRWSQVSALPTHARDTLTGDLCCPVGFLWVIECKGGYSQVDLGDLISGTNATIEAFLSQSLHDSHESGRRPIVMWKRDRKPWIAILHESIETEVLRSRLNYSKWVLVDLQELLDSTSDEFWFD